MPKAFMLRLSVLVLSSTQPSLFSLLIAAQASAASAISLLRGVRPRGSALARRHLAMPVELALAAQCTRRYRLRPCYLASVLVLSSEQFSLCSPLTAPRASVTSALGRVAVRGALARRRLAMPVAALARCAMHAVSSMAHEFVASVLVRPTALFSL